MAMRPRTFRRLILALVFGGVICVGLIGYFVVGPMQQKRSIEELRSTGMKAYEDGDYGPDPEGRDRDFEPVSVGAGGAADAALRPSRTGLVAAKKPRLKAGRKAVTERQGKLNLGLKNNYQTPPLDFLEEGPKDARQEAVLEKHRAGLGRRQIGRDG